MKSATRKCNMTQVQSPIIYISNKYPDVHPVIRAIGKSRDHVGDALGSEMHYRRKICSPGTSLETSPTSNWIEEIAYDWVWREHWQSSTVNRTAPNDSTILIDGTDNITPECVQLMITRWEVTRRQYLSQLGFIVLSLAVAFPSPGVYLSVSLCTNQGGAFCECKDGCREHHQDERIHGEDVLWQSTLPMTMSKCLLDSQCPPTILPNTHRNEHGGYKSLSHHQGHASSESTALLRVYRDWGMM